MIRKVGSGFSKRTLRSIGHCPQIVRAAPQAVLVGVTDPPDPLADVAREAAGHDRVLSTGTFLDSLRFRVHLGKHFDVDPAHVEAQVIGDHGTTGVPVVVRPHCRRGGDGSPGEAW